ncbi:NAD(P)/FAD-dependent oxidoreductase [Nocardia xishanensis]|uniref:NAD(P)/FAD-dependent oxidoreductase n=1 Tax=Nocardia xishanensis TaxID=238964 RepID=UPI0008318A8F|nr:FAD-dependent oxidoreductase [Nocardia xishanensis]
MSPARPQVVVLGGGFAGLLAASAAAPHAGAVIVLERDRYPQGSESRRGLPQSRHPHFLAPGGVLGLERLLPGIAGRLLAAGAHRIGVNTDLLFRSGAGGWMARNDTGRFGITCSRSLLDRVVRAMVVEADAITVRQGCEPVRLVGSATAVRGVRVRDAAAGTTEQLEADLVIDATGRGSQAGRWLDALGIAAPPTEVVDSGHAYATRVFRAAPGAESGFPVVLIQAESRSGTPGGNAILLPIECGRWIVAIGGTRGRELPADDDEFVDYARRGVSDPLVAEILASAEPLTGTMRSRSTGNRRYRFDRVRSWPAGFVVVGDAVTALNPVYGQGLSVATRCAGTLVAEFARRGVAAGAAPRLQRSIVRAGTDPWQMATSQDLAFRNTESPGRTVLDRWKFRYGARVFRVAESRPAVAGVASDVMFLARPALAMGHPVVLAGAVLGPRRPPLTEPPLTGWERGFVAGRRVG